MCDPATLLSLAGFAGQLAAKPKIKPDAKLSPTLLGGAVEGATSRRKPTDGFGSTLLTGASGVAPGATNIGTNTLLGQ